MGKIDRGYWYIINTVILFSTYEVVSKSLVGKMDLFQVTFLRFLAGGLVLLGALAIKKDLKIGLRNLGELLLIGAINVFFSMNLLQLSLSVPNAKASIAAVIFCSNPVFVSLFSALLDREKLTLYKVAGMLTALAGIIVISTGKLDVGGINIKSPLLALGSSALYGLYTVMGRKASARMGSLKMNSYSFIFGSLLMLPFLLLWERPVFAVPAAVIPQMVYLALFVTGIAYVTYFMGLSRVGASKGSLVFFIKPALASLMAGIFLKEKLTMELFAGIILILAGIAVVIYWDRIKKRFAQSRCRDTEV